MHKEYQGIRELLLEGIDHCAVHRTDKYIRLDDAVSKKCIPIFLFTHQSIGGATRESDALPQGSSKRKEWGSCGGKAGADGRVPHLQHWPSGQLAFPCWEPHGAARWGEGRNESKRRE